MKSPIVLQKEIECTSPSTLTISFQLSPVCTIIVIIIFIAKLRSNSSLSCPDLHMKSQFGHQFKPSSSHEEPNSNHQPTMHQFEMLREDRLLKEWHLLKVIPPQTDMYETQEKGSGWFNSQQPQSARQCCLSWRLTDSCKSFFSWMWSIQWLCDSQHNQGLMWWAAVLTASGRLSSLLF